MKVFASKYWFADSLFTRVQYKIPFYLLKVYLHRHTARAWWGFIVISVPASLLVHTRICTHKSSFHDSTRTCLAYLLNSAIQVKAKAREHRQWLQKFMRNSAQEQRAICAVTSCMMNVRRSCRKQNNMFVALSLLAKRANKRAVNVCKKPKI